ncbi:MAG: hypothetical protein M1815_000891 [Lichina confinis]|nr:MAG: hypothetical protein M1815_000891 [Lichina confinis]
MVNKRTLPKVFNPLLQPDQAPKYDELVERRRLGQTDLRVKAGSVGTSNATKSKNLGVFDYAHLKVPLPRHMVHAELFGGTAPDIYFLMRRSSDGFVSASGMFKAAFPAASLAEEETERKNLKSLATTSTDETAGNLWIPPTHALQLAELYRMEIWVRALLDTATIEKGMDSKRPIQPPPPFIPLEDNPFYAPPHLQNPNRPMTRLRSSSPSRAAAAAAAAATPAKKVASPRKRSARSAANASARAAANAQTNAQALAQLDEATAAVDPVKPRASRSADWQGHHQKDDDDDNDDDDDDEESPVQVKVDSGVRTNGEFETRFTNVRVEMPPSLPELSSPDDPQKMVDAAKEMVAEAQKLESQISKVSRKRKANHLVEIDDDDDGDGDDDNNNNKNRNKKNRNNKGSKLDEDDADIDVYRRDLKPAKRAKVLERSLREERMQSRAWIGVSTTLAVL